MLQPEEVQLVTPVQWQGIQNTVKTLKASEAESGLPLPPEWGDLVNHWTRLLVASTGETVQPFAITEHFLSLIEMFLDGAPDDGTEIGSGTRAVMEWGETVLATAEQFDLHPVANSEQCAWLVLTGYYSDDE